jgi:putative transposase
LKDVGSILKASRQAFHKQQARQISKQMLLNKTIGLCDKMRAKHPRMGLKKIYHHYKSDLSVGRDKFIELATTGGYRLKRLRSPHKTTVATRLATPPNLIDGLVLTRCNQLWQSDIFYLQVGKRHMYGVTIIDVYSRRLLALHVSKTMKANDVYQALKKAIKTRTKESIRGCIFHSDRGRQYMSEKLRSLFTSLDIHQSMCKRAQQNSYCERVQGTVKNEYLMHLNINEGNILTTAARVKNLYNKERYHIELSLRTPIEFERYINNLQESKRPKTHVYQWIEPELTKINLINKKEKSSKKEKTTTTITSL